MHGKFELTVMLSAGVSDYCEILRLKCYAWYKVHYPYVCTMCVQPV